MAARGPKSLASLAVVTTLPGQRPEPPDDLTKPQADEWRAVVGRMQPNWFTRETHGLLAAFCKHSVTLRVVSARIEDLEQRLTDEDVQLYDKLLQMREREGRAMSSLATRMRLTQQSRYDAKTANTAEKSGGTSGAKPWSVAG